VAVRLHRVLVANRGEIAVRIIRACHEIGLEAVAVYSDADAAALHVRAADLSVRIGPAPAAESYLHADAIIAAARAARCDAIHPGYGFLSERAPFARACEDADIVFVGPAADTLAGLGDKLAARRAASAAAVAVVPGTLEPAPVGDLDAAGRALLDAEGVGWPLMVKASAGGGGRGMRRVDRPEELPTALLAASREALGAFGDGSVYLERYIEEARHVEVQLLGDEAGAIVALGERDCSVQRRHQKLLEESPAPGLPADRRREVHALAVRVARAFGLKSAATAEFLLAPDGRFWFLEVNTRLQVEHGVTELVTGVDLVQEQLRVAAGEPLSERVCAAGDRAAAPDRHAVEVRISAEDPARGFAPDSGTVTRWREPGGPGVRVDSGVEEGSRVGTDYDALLAKLMVVAEDRGAALARLRRALDEFEIAGLQTTLPFHRWVVADPAFAAGRVSTSFVDDRWRPGPMREAAARRAAQQAAAWATSSDYGRRPTDGQSPTRHGDGGIGTPPRPPGAPADGPWSGPDRASDGWRSAARREGVSRWEP